MSTNRIAERAGVSIGSLYQYSPGKEAITATVIRASYRWTFDPLIAVLERGAETDANLEELVGTFFEKVFDIKRANLATEMALVSETVRQGLTDLALQLDAEYITRITRALDALKPRVRADLDSETAAYLLFQAVRAPLILGPLQRPDLIHSGALADELKRLLLRYVVKD